MIESYTISRKRILKVFREMISSLCVGLNGNDMIMIMCNQTNILHLEFSRNIWLSNLRVWSPSNKYSKLYDSSWMRAKLPSTKWYHFNGFLIFQNISLQSIFVFSWKLVSMQWLCPTRKSSSSHFVEVFKNINLYSISY